MNQSFGRTWKENEEWLYNLLSCLEAGPMMGLIISLSELLLMKANQDWALMLYNLANIKPSDIYSLTEDTDRALCQNHPETDWSVLLVALHCTACGNFAEWICSKTNYVRLCQFVCVGGGGGEGGRDGDKVVNFFISLFISSRIFENVIVKWTFRVQQFFFFGRNLQSSYYKN